MTFAKSDENIKDERGEVYPVRGAEDPEPEPGPDHQGPTAARGGDPHQQSKQRKPSLQTI